MLTISKSGKYARVPSQKFVKELGRENADPSTPVAAKNAAAYAQDDTVIVKQINDSPH